MICAAARTLCGRYLGARNHGAGPSGPLSRYSARGCSHSFTRKPNKFRRALVYWLFNPDPTVVWARARPSTPLYCGHGRHRLILSSSPPESAHVGAWLLSQYRTGVPHIVDMRDGWLDEPLKPLLRSSDAAPLVRGRMELVSCAMPKLSNVTSDVCKSCCASVCLILLLRCTY